MGARGPAPKERPILTYRAGVPDAPDWLSEVGAEEYRRVVDEMQKSGVPAARVDYACLVSYAASFEAYMRLIKECAQLGETTVCASSGRQMLAPRVMLRDRAQRAMLTAGERLGFTPASRSRIPKTLSPTIKASNPFKAFVNDGGEDE